MVETGKKTVEGRLKKPELKVLKVGDKIRFQDNSHSKSFVDVKIISLNAYPTFREMLQKEGLHRCLPDLNSLEEGVDIYHSFPSYREKEKLLGVLAIGIQKLGDKV